MRSRFSISGIVYEPSGAPAPKDTEVVLYRRELRHRTLLAQGFVAGNDGAFSIAYGDAETFGPADMPPHLELRALDPSGRMRAVSDVIFCPEPALADVRLALEPVPEPPRPETEFARLRAALAAAVGTVSVDGLSARERDFVLGAVCRTDLIRPEAAPALLDRLAEAERLAAVSGYGLEAAYGLVAVARGSSVGELTDLPLDEVARRLAQAAAGRLISPDAAAIARTPTRPTRPEPIPRHLMRLRLLDAQSGAPVAEAPLSLDDAGAPVALPGLATDVDGRVGVVIAFETDAPRQLDLTVFDRTDARIGRARVDVVPDAPEQDVRVALEPGARPLKAGLGDISDGPEVATLMQRGIRTIGQLLRAPEQVEGIEPDDLSRLRREARWRAAGLDTQEAEVLRAFGFDGPIAVARIDRARFLDIVGLRLGSLERAAGFHAAARLYEAHVARQVSDAWLVFGEEGGDGEDPDAGPAGGVDFGDIFDDLAECGCDDCESALSPGAYLAHLLDWLTTHVVSAGAPIRLEQLEDGFHQPFADLPTSCDHAQEKFRQVRLAIEVLWRFTGGPSSPGETVFNARHAHYRAAAYRAILAGLGVTFEDLLVAQAPGAALDDLRSRLAQRLAVAVADLPEFVLAEAPDEASLQALFGLRRTNLPHSVEVPISTAARLRAAELGRRWLAEDTDDDAWGPDQSEPAIDPRVIDETVIRAPRDNTNPVFVLFVARRDALQAERVAVETAAADAAGLLTEITTRLGIPLGEMQGLRDTLAAADDADAVAAARAQIRDALFLEIGAFLRLVEIAERLDAEGDAALQDAALAADAADILVGRHATTLRTDWIDEEIAQVIVLDAARFHQPDLPDLPRPPLLVPPRLVAEWRLALRRRSSDPEIDPHHLSPADIVTFVEDGFAPFADDPRRESAADLLEERQTWAEGRRSALAAARTGAGGVADQYAAVLAESAVPDLQSRIDAVLELEAAGHDILRPVEQLAFSMPGFRETVALGQRAGAGLPLLPDQWDGLFAVLVEVEKRLRSTEWRAEERGRGIALHPKLFDLPADAPAGLDATGRAAFARRWARRRSIREDALTASFESLERAVAAAEDATLEILRDALIRRGPLTDQSLAERRAALDARLLVAMDQNGCACTTRIAFAIETLQRFLRGVLDGELTDALDNVEIDAENLAAAESLLSYQEWRAALFAFLWPENLTSRVLPRRVSYGLSTLAGRLPNRLTPEPACNLAADYDQYFRDLCAMQVSATCLATTFIAPPDSCEPNAVTLADRLFLFSHAEGADKTGRVYWAMLDPAERPGDTRTPWRPLGRLGEVERILGATVHSGLGRSFVVLLVQDSDGGAARLRLRAYDLEAGRWLAPRTLNIPQEARDNGFDAAILRKYARPGSSFERDIAEIPAVVALHPEGGGLYLRRLSADLSGWADKEWSPVQGPSAELRLRDFVQVRDDEAALLLADEVGVSCRTVGLTTPYLNDDFVPISLNSNFGIYAGAIGWPDRNELIAFATPVGETRYRIVEFDATQTGIPDSDPAFEVSGIAPIEARLRDEVGVSLDDPDLFRFEGFKPFLQVPKNIPNLSLYAASLNPLNFPNTEEIVGDFRPRPDLEPFSGTLYDLLTLSLTTFEGMVGPFDNEAAYIQGADKVYYLIQYKNFGIEAFIEALDELTETDPFGTPAYWWTFLDAQIMRLTEGRFGVRGLIRQAFHNVIADDMVDYGWDPDFDEETASPIAFIERISDLDISGQLSAGTREIRIASTAGHDHLAGASNEKPVAIWKQPLSTTDENGAYWTVARRSGGTISAVGDQRITPNTCPSLSILPPEDMAELADRRDGSELVYTRNADGPPSIQGLLRERFFIIPVMLGDALCAAGFYDEAQRWFRSVYHAGGDPGARKIDYGLVLEESRPLSFNAIDDWLRDPEDVHAVALGRRESDTRRVLLSIVACLVAEADALFARDLPETISEARDLYRRAIELLARLRGITGVDLCADIIGSLRFELEDRPDLPIDDFVLILGTFPQPGIVRTTVDALIAIARDPSVPARETVRQMRARIAEVRPVDPARRPVAERIERRATVMRRAEARLLATEDSRARLTQVMRTAETRRRTLIGRIEDARAEATSATSDRGAWLAARRDPPRPDPRDRDGDGRIDLVRADATRFGTAVRLRATAPLAEVSLAGFDLTDRTSGTVLSFCIPQNPEIVALRRRAETALDRIRACRNFAGYERAYDPYGGPIGVGSRRLDAGAPAQIDTPPVPLRFGTLLPQARELADVAAQIEGRYLAALEGEDRERLTRLQAEQNLEVSEARVARSALAVGAGEANVDLAQRQRDSAVIAAEHYDDLIKAGINKHERKVIETYLKAGETNPLKNFFSALGRLGKFGLGVSGFGNPFSGFGELVSLAEDAAQVLGGEADQDTFFEGTTDIVSKGYDALLAAVSSSGKIDVASLEGFRADLERRAEDWQVQRNLARQDIEIGTQEIVTEQFSLELARADQEIAEIERDHAIDILTFLQMKNLTTEAYRWMSKILGEAYREVLQRAAATGQMAERALAFERLARPAATIAGDYWQVDLATRPDSDVAVDLRGLTGSSRLQRDLVRLQDYAVSSLTRRVPIEMRVDLALLDPDSFQLFRETGILDFDTTREAFQRQLPGYFAASISSVSLDVQALTLTGDGVRMTLESRGMSRAVIRPDNGDSTLIRGLPEVRFLTGTGDGDARLALIPQGDGLRGPFEGTGFEQSWRLTADRGANALLDFDGITGMIFTLRGTARYSPLHAAQIRSALGRDRRGDVILSLRRDFAGAWAALQAAAGEDAPLTIGVAIERGLYPVNLGALSLDHLLLAVVSPNIEETAFDAVLITPSEAVAAVGGAATTVEGRISTRNGTGALLSDLLGGPPTGDLLLRFAEAARPRLADGSIGDVLVVISYSGEIA